MGKRKKDEKEFSRLLEMNQGIIHKISFLYSKDESDKEDLFQEICLQLWRSFSDFRRDSKFSTWMYRVSLNTAINYTRRRVSWLLFGNSFAEEPIATDTFAGDEDAHLLTQLISMLNKIDRAIILLWLEGQAYAEIAEVLGISEKNVSVRLVRIKQAMKSQVDKTTI